MKEVRTQDAVGMVIPHDITRITGSIKDTPFRKGHIITEEDIPLLLSIGKEHIYILEYDDTMLHENDAAEILRGICQGENIASEAVREGKIELIAEADGLFKVDIERLRAINSLGDMMIATIPCYSRVKKDEKLAGTRVIPLVIKKDEMERAKALAGTTPLLSIKPFKPKRYGVVTTGSEVFHKRIEDIFTPAIERKLKEFNSEMVAHEISDDDNENIEKAIKKMIANKDVEMIICTGGMSVDPDDKTPLAIKNSGADIVSYGSPVLPGAMFLIGYLKDGRPILGLPGCVMYNKRTVFDLILPLIMAEEKVTKEYIYGLGHGGFCRNCEICHFPNCSFGRGF